MESQPGWLPPDARRPSDRRPAPPGPRPAGAEAADILVEPHSVADLGRFERLWPGLTARLITHRLDGFADHARIAGEIDEGIKTVVEISSQ